MKNLFVGILWLTAASFCLSQTNNQINWQQTNGAQEWHVKAIAVSGTNIYAGTQGDGVFLSTNRGTSWTQVNNGLTDKYVNTLVISGTNIFAGTGGSFGVYLSTNNGTSWNEVNAGLTDLFVNSLTASDNNLFAGTYFGGIFFSTNNGTSWTQVNNGLTNTLTVMALAVSGINHFAAVLTAPYYGILLSTNNGTSWTQMNNGLTNPNVNALTVSGTNLVAGTNDGLFFSTNNGTSWTQANNGLTNSYVTSVAISDTNLFAGTDGGGVFVGSLPVNYKAPSAPQNLTAAVGNAKVTLRWNKNTETDFLRYRIYMGIDSMNLSFRDSTTASILDTTKLINDLTNGTKYYFRVSALNSARLESKQSIAASATPSAFSSLAITSFTPTRNALNVSTNTNITLTFNNDINSSTLSNNTMRINGLLSGLHPGTFSYNQATHTITVTPNSQFKVGETVTTTVTRRVMNATGDSLPSSYSWNFKVGTSAAMGTYQQSSTAGVGNTPWYLTAADFNGDGAIDLAVVNNYSNDVSILTNNGMGVFTKTSTVNVGSYPGSITSADLDGDGDMDLAVTNSQSNTVSILKNNGNGTFTQTSAVTVAGDPWNVTAVDVDGDGTIDLAVASYSGTVSILKNNGSGSFVVSSTVTVGSGAYSVTAADVNNDGAIDLVVTNFGSTTISILTNNGSGSFTQTSTVNVGNSPVAATATDMDGDGSVDLAVANFNSKTISILKNNGSGIFALSSTINMGFYLSSVLAVDPDGNGIADLVVVNQDGNKLSILRNNGSGSFEQASTVSTGTGSSPRTVTAADFDGDGKIDLATANLNNNSMSILINRQLIAPAPPQNLTAAAGNGQLTIRWNKNNEDKLMQYRIYRATSPNPTTMVDSTTGGITDTIRVYNGLTNGMIYYFRVTAVDNSGLESAYSNEISATPAIPAGFSIALSDVTASTAGATVLVPVTVSNFTNVGAVTLKINYNPAVVTFVNVANSTSGVTFIVGNTTPGVINLNWFDATGKTPLNIISGKLVDLNFSYIGGASYFTFNPSQCDIANGSGTSITGITYQSGSVSHSNIITVSGTVAYANIAATPISNATVTLTPATGIALTAASSTTGTYSFASVTAGTYTLTASKKSNWGGVNSTDALLVAKYSAGISTLAGLPLMAADVNSNGTVNSTDALLIARRSVGLDNSFVAGDWVFTSAQTITVGTSNVTSNISGLAVGDVNASYTPVSGTAFAKSPASVNLTNGANKITISGSSAVALGAVSLKINVHSAKVASISSKLQGFVSRVDDAGVSFGWFAKDGQPVHFDANEAIATVTLADKADDKCSVTIESELADISGTTLDNNLAVTVKEIPTVFALNQNYPNPFNPSTTIQYGLPVRSTVRLVVYNVLGQVVKELVNTEQQAGYQSVVWNAIVSSGMYFYRLEAASTDDPSKRFVETKKMLLLR